MDTIFYGIKTLMGRTLDKVHRQFTYYVQCHKLLTYLCIIGNDMLVPLLIGLFT